MRLPVRQANSGNEKQYSDEAADIGGYGESLTVQSQMEDADLNVLMKRFGITGKMPENVRIPTYGDFSEIVDYRTAIEAVRSADVAFMEIPAEVRAKFANDPQNFLLFAADPANLPEMVKLGLAKERIPNGGSESGDAGAGKASGGAVAASGGSDGGNKGAA